MNEHSLKHIKQLFNVIIEEMKTNEAFSAKIEAIINPNSLNGDAEYNQKKETKKNSVAGRASNRRDPAVLDPIATIIESEEVLQNKLQELSEKELKDIIAQYGMDTSKLAMKWKNKQRLIDLIVDVSRARSKKGDAFRNLS